MAKTCSICAHEDTQQITMDLLAGVTFREIAKKYGVSTSALNRHKKHIAAQMITQPEAVAVLQPESVMAKVKELERRANRIYASAEAEGDQLNAIRAIKELREIVSLYAKLTGELNTQAQIVHQHVHVSPEWVSLRKTIITALEPFPAACQAVSEALERYDHEHTIE